MLLSPNLGYTWEGLSIKLKHNAPNGINDVLEVLHCDLPTVALVLEKLVSQSWENSPQRVRLCMLEPRLTEKKRTFVGEKRTKRGTV